MTERKLPAEEAILFNTTNRLGQALMDSTLKVVGLSGTPKMVSCILFSRLWRHHRGYALLFKDGLAVESDTLLRSTVEVAICIAANSHVEGGLWEELKCDALHTVTRQIEQARKAEDKELERDGEKTRRWLATQILDGMRSKKLDMSDLAERGQSPMLYNFYRALSQTSSHVTGLTIMRDVVGVDGAGNDLQREWSNLTKKTHHLWQMAAVLQSCFLHALMIDEEEQADAALTLARQLEARLAAIGF